MAMYTENELKTLSKKRQSPINIIDEISRPKCLPPLTLIGHWLNDGEAVIVNTDEYPIIFLSGRRLPSLIKCGPLEDEYEFHNAHFHWGETDSCGSEHQLEGTVFSMEAHVVHWNRKYQTFEECLKYEDGLCVLAYFFLVKNICNCEDYSALDKITDRLRKIRVCGTKTDIPANSLCWMRAATECPYYYYYRGSFNKGDFPECAIWIVFPIPIPIRPDQLAEFRKLRDEKGRPIRCNLRQIQHLNDRKIHKAVF